MPATSHIAARLASARTTFLDMLETIPEDRLGDVPPHFDKNAAWLVGHIRAADAFAAKVLGSAAPAVDLKGHFGPGSSGTVTLGEFRDIFGSRQAASASLRASHQAVVESVRSLPDSALDRTIADERVRAFVPDIGSFLTYLIWHEGWHAGQLSQWCKALGVGKAAAA